MTRGGRQTIRLERLAQYVLATAGILALGFHLANSLRSEPRRKARDVILSFLSK
jgi:hypothetical protein